MNKKIYLSPPHMTGNEQEYINEAFSTNWVAPLGPNVDRFEKEISEYVGSKGAVVLCSGTAAIHLALKLLGVKEGDIVFCSSLTFIATANPILYERATPVFIDSDPDTWNLSPLALKNAIEVALKKNKMPKALIVVHLYGQPAKMDEISSICNQYNIPIIEDAAESLGSLYKGKQSGTFGKFGVYSFNGNKIITTSGGGALVSDDLDALKMARFLATQAKEPALHYEHKMTGYNYRMSNILAGVGRAQLQALDNRIAKRREIFFRYKEKLRKISGIHFMPELLDTMSNHWLTAITLNPDEIKLSPYELIRLLNNDHIETRPLWKPLHSQPVFDGTEYFQHSQNESFSDKLFLKGICLPSGSSLTLEDQDRVVESIIKYLTSSI